MRGSRASVRVARARARACACPCARLMPPSLSSPPPHSFPFPTLSDPALRRAHCATPFPPTRAPCRGANRVQHELRARVHLSRRALDVGRVQERTLCNQGHGRHRQRAARPLHIHGPAAPGRVVRYGRRHRRDHGRNVEHARRCACLPQHHRTRLLHVPAHVCHRHGRHHQRRSRRPHQVRVVHGLRGHLAPRHLLPAGALDLLLRRLALHLRRARLRRRPRRAPRLRRLGAHARLLARQLETREA